jgi:drug/metabolite transporter (DMT)-like permease
MAAVLALLSGLLWGTADFAGGVMSRRLRALAVVGWSQGVALLALVTVVLITGTRAPLGGWLPWGIAAGLSGAGGLVCFYRALAVGTMGVVAPIAALGVLAPVLVGLADGERPRTWQWVGMGLALLGVIAASGPELSGAVEQRSSVALAGASGLLFGISLTCMARGAVAGPVLTVTAMRLASMTLFVLIALLARTVGGVGTEHLPALVAVGLADAGANLLYSYAVTLGMLTVVAVLGSLYPVATVVLARVFLHERLQPVQTVGVVLALGGVALLSAA